MGSRKVAYHITSSFCRQRRSLSTHGFGTNLIQNTWIPFKQSSQLISDDAIYDLTNFGVA